MEGVSHGSKSFRYLSNTADLDGSSAVFEKYLSNEPVDEPMIMEYMRMLWHAGRKEKAIKLYNNLVKTIARDFDTVPEPETRALFQKIKGWSK